MRKERLKLSLIVLFGLILALVCIAWSLGGVGKLLEKAKIPKVIPSPKEKALPEVSLALDPKEKTVYQNEGFTVNILVQSEKELIGADLYLSYDPKSLEISRVEPGGFFANPQELSKRVDVAEGKAFYALTSLTPKTGKGILASFTFKGKLGNSEGLVFIDEKTQVSIQEEEKVNLKLPAAGKYTILKSTK